MNPASLFNATNTPVWVCDRRLMIGFKHGPVFTIEGRRDDTLDAHESLLKWCELLSKAPAHVVLICQPNDHTLAHMGELSSETLAYKNVLGYIVDGGCRDSAFIEKLGFPVFCAYYTPLGG